MVEAKELEEKENEGRFLQGTLLSMGSKVGKVRGSAGYEN